MRKSFAYTAYTKKERGIKKELVKIVMQSAYTKKDQARVSVLNKRLSKIRSERQSRLHK